MRILFSLLLLSLSGTILAQSSEPIDAVTIGIFLKQRSPGLPLFLASIENQTYPKHKTHLYIQPLGATSSMELVAAWVDAVKDEYASVYIAECTRAESDIFLNNPAESPEFFKLSGLKRDQSLRWAYAQKSHYFTCDTDFFCAPHVIDQLLKTNLEIVSPMLNSYSGYSNFHAAVDEIGYFKNCDRYWQILKQEIKGIVEVPVVNGVYCIQHSQLPELSYCDESARYEYVILSDCARKKNIHQYLDNQAEYGIISFAQHMSEIAKIAGISKYFEVSSRCTVINDYLRIFKPKASPAQSVFTEIYEKKMWGTNAEGLGWSGGGSSAQATSVYRAFLQDFLTQYQIKSVVDLGCGDWEFSKLIEWGTVHYLGLDVVDSVIQRNTMRYSRDNISFKQFDAIQDELPAGQLLLCKDVLQHLTNADILAISQQFKKFKYCLITNGVDPVSFSSDNHDISRGDYRPVDLSKPPFNLACTKMITYRAGGFMMQTVLIEN